MSGFYASFDLEYYICIENMSEVKPKYRLLTDEELNELETEFVHFLVVNGIAADDWEKLKSEDKDKANDFITLFSDVILEGSLRKIEYIEFRSTHDLKIFKCGQEDIEMIGVEATGSIVDFVNLNFDESSIPEGVQIYSAKKKYATVREKEIFKMIQSGCMIVKGDLFYKLSRLKSEL